MGNSVTLLQLRQLQLSVQAALDDALRSFGLTAAQFTLLEALAQNPGASSAELARACSVTAQSAHALVQTLDAHGLLVREPHRIHGRVIRAYLSNAGETRLAAARTRVAELESRVLTSFSGDEREQLSRFIGMLSASLQNQR